MDHFYASNGTVEMPHWSHKFEDKITADHIGLDMVPSNNLNVRYVVTLTPNL